MDYEPITSIKDRAKKDLWVPHDFSPAGIKPLRHVPWLQPWDTHQKPTESPRKGLFRQIFFMVNVCTDSYNPLQYVYRDLRKSV